MLEISDLTFGFADRSPLVAALSFAVMPGQIRLVQGASGSGKSTLLGLISGTQHENVIWQGKIVLDGVDVTATSAENRGIGIMFQDPLLFPHLTVADNLAFGLCADVPRAHRRDHVAAALTSAGLDGFADRDPATLSGGQAARAGLMRSLLARPRALLLDEAFSPLDPDLRAQFGTFVSDQIQERGIPALLVSHDAGDAAFASGDVIKI